MKDSGKSDVLYGLGAIAEYLGMTGRQAKHRVATGGVPVFKMGGRMLCARRSTLNAWLADQEAKSRRAAA